MLFFLIHVHSRLSHGEASEGDLAPRRRSLLVAPPSPWLSDARRNSISQEIHWGSRAVFYGSESQDRTKKRAPRLLTSRITFWV